RIPDLGDEEGPDHLSIAAAAEIDPTVTDDDQRTVPTEIAIHGEGTRYGQNAVPAGTAGETQIAVDVIDYRTGRAAERDTRGVIAVRICAWSGMNGIDECLQSNR